MGFKQKLLHRINKSLSCHYEEDKVVSFLHTANISIHSRGLDVGCGYGRNMEVIINTFGCELEGVDINSKIVEENRKRGLKCCTVEEFQNREEKSKYDFIILSHVIEHFHPENLKEFLEYYTAEQMRRHEVKPGMTGLAQVSGRNNLSWEEKFELDVQYVEQYNIWFDFKIMFKTAKVMLSQEGINAPDQEVGAARFSKKSIHDTSLFTKEVK